MTITSTQSSSFNPRGNKFLTILTGALLFGVGWQIRGRGTSDPSVVILLFLLFLSVLYGPRQKFNMIIFAFAILVFGIMRTGWGTFTGQSGIPGFCPGYIGPDNEELLRNLSYEVVVPWWQGYFWLFVVGIAWAGLPALIFGGYFFTAYRYSLKDLAVCIVVFLIGNYIAGFIVEQLIPLIAGEYYQQIYLPGISKRNYLSMHGNMAKAIAIIPVLFYIFFGKKDRAFAWRSLIVMVIFGIGFSVAAIWHGLGRVYPEWTSPFYSLWEYFSGFIIGGLLFWFYGRLSETELRESDISPGLESLEKGGKFGRFVIYATALYFFVLYGLQDSLAGSIRLACKWSGVEMVVSQEAIQGILLVIILFLYYFYRRGDIGAGWGKKSFREKSFIALLVYLPFTYLNFATPYFVAGQVSRLNEPAGWLNLISTIIVEIYVLSLYRQFRRSLAPS